MENKPTSFRKWTSSTRFQVWSEALAYTRFTCRLSELVERGFGSEDAMKVAMQRAMQTCIENHIVLSKHFRRSFIPATQPATLREEWLLSRLALTLILLSSDPNHPAVRSFHVKLAVDWVKE